MRWDNLRADATSAQGALFDLDKVVERTFDTPEFRGMTFYEIRARSIINRVPEASQMPFRWTINPYRGCSHACVYCFARNTHEYLDMDAGHDFDSKVVVKVNAPELLRKELTAPRWAGEHIAMGTNVDCYQRAEGRYGLMRPILETLRDSRNPFSILTKGTLILRDLDLLTQAAERAPVSVSISVGSVDETVWREVEPGTPAPRARLAVCRALTDAGIGCGVLMAPILPMITDSPAQLDATVAAITAAGARSVSPIVLHLRPGAREWYLAWLERTRPDLVEPYRTFYGKGSYTPKAYQRHISQQVADLSRQHGIVRDSPGRIRRPRAPARGAALRSG